MLGLIYRRLAAPAELAGARRLLATGAPGYRSPRLSGDEAWSGLCNLTAAGDAALVAAAATWPASARTLEVRALISAENRYMTHVMARLIRELADAARALGTEHLLAATTIPNALLHHAGFHQNTPDWLTLPL